LHIPTNVKFSRSSGKLSPDARVTWEWEQFGVSDDVVVREFELNKHLLIEWGSPGDPTTLVAWDFDDRPDNTTFVTITNYGFHGTQDETAVQAIASTEGFTLVLCNLKALLEHTINLRLIADRFPDGIDAEK
jgi:uncharacterized protein YndB with AHSA1/START domain